MIWNDRYITVRRMKENIAIIVAEDMFTIEWFWFG